MHFNSKLDKSSNATTEDCSSLDIFTWVKDKNFRFITCSENLAKLAGEDSPDSMRGKDDYNLIWQKGAEFFRKKDTQIIKSELKYVNVVEAIDVARNGIVSKEKILITKIPIYNKRGTCIGIAGSHVNLPHAHKPRGACAGLDQDGRFWLPNKLGNEYLTKKEFEVLKLILLGKTSKQIAKILGISYRTVEEHTGNIRKKLQCSSKYEIHAVAIEYGITHIL